MNELLSFANLISYFGDIDTARAFCENMYWNTMYNDNAHIVNACSNIWNNIK